MSLPGLVVVRALVSRPGPALADEPTVTRDRDSATKDVDLIAQINRKEGTAFLISTHDDRTISLCRRQFVVADGHLTG